MVTGDSGELRCFACDPFVLTDVAVVERVDAGMAWKIGFGRWFSVLLGFWALVIFGLGFIGGAPNLWMIGIFIGVGTVELTNSTVSGNSATNGGGIDFNSGILKLVNSTVSGNASSGNGGGLHSTGGGSLTRTNESRGALWSARRESEAPSDQAVARRDVWQTSRSSIPASASPSKISRRRCPSSARSTASSTVATTAPVSACR